MMYLAEKQRSEMQQTKHNQKWVAILFVLLVVALCSSGCMQAKETDAGVALYNKVAEYLPDDAIHNPDVYEIMTKDDQTIYLWREVPYEVTAEEAYGKGNFRIYEAEKYYLYERALEITVSADTQEILGYAYDRKEDVPERFHEIASMSAMKQPTYVQEQLPSFLAERGALALCKVYMDKEGTQYYITSDNIQKSVAKSFLYSNTDSSLSFISENTVQDRQYLIKYNQYYGYIEAIYSWYHDENLEEQVESWLAVENTRLYGKVYDINWYEVSVGSEARQENQYTISLFFTMIYQNSGDRDTNTYLNQLKTSGSPDYQRMYDEYYRSQDGTEVLKVEAEILSDGTLDMEHCILYEESYGEDGIDVIWHEIPGLYVYYRDGKSELAGWNKDKTQVVWVADRYLQAFVQQDMDTMQQVSTVEPLVSSSKYLGKGYGLLEPTGQQYRQHLVDCFQELYGGEIVVDADTTVELCLDLNVYDRAFTEDRLTLVLQKIDGLWKVTNAELR